MHKKERRRSMNNEMITVIQDGINLMKNPYFDDNMFLAWMDYSRKMLALVSKNAMIKYQYTTFLMSIISSQDSPTVKLQKCIDYLMNIAPII